MTHYKGKRLSAIDRAQQLELARQKAVDDKHDAQFVATIIFGAIFTLWCFILTILLIVNE